jgi:hypothetical protein
MHEREGKMTTPWQSVNPDPQEPGDLPEWANMGVAITLAIITLVGAVIVMWPANQQFGKDLGTLIIFAIQCSLASSVVTGIYMISVVLGTLYEKYPGQTSVHPGALAVGATGLATPWIAATIAVIAFVAILFIVGAILVVILIGGLLGSMSS